MGESVHRQEAAHRLAARTRDGSARGLSRFPFNPFIEGGDTIYPSRTVELAYIGIDSAEDFEQMAVEGDWSPAEVQALNDAAAMVRFSVRVSERNESEVIFNRLNSRGGLTLLLREVADDKEGK